MLFTVIVPIYNVEEYLGRCVNSILTQTFEDFELILVDDGSQDHCPEMCDAFAEKDPRVRVIHKPNGGLVSARNAGIMEARGDYICYVDGDDWIKPNLLAFVFDRLADTSVPVLAEEIRAAKENNHRVIRTHGKAGDGRRPRIPGTDQRHRFINDIAEILFLSRGAPGVFPAFQRPAFTIHCIHHKKLDPALFNKIGQMMDHSEIFVIAAHGVLGRKREKRNPVMAVNHHVHFPVQGGTPVR